MLEYNSYICAERNTHFSFPCTLGPVEKNQGILLKVFNNHVVQKMLFICQCLFAVGKLSIFP